MSEGEGCSDGNVQTEDCPVCRSEPSDVTWQTAPGQSVCGNKSCPVNTWNEKQSVPTDTDYSGGGGQ